MDGVLSCGGGGKKWRDQLAWMLESVEKLPHFKEILAPLSETRPRYQEYVQQRNAAKKM